MLKNDDKHSNELNPHFFRNLARSYLTAAKAIREKFTDGKAGVALIVNLTPYKILSAVAIILSVFSSNVFSMQEENNFISSSLKHSSLSVPIREDIEKTTLISKKEKSCSHWGLSHWLSGIGEYLQVCVGCTVNKKEGMYKHAFGYAYTGKYEREYISDCCFPYNNDHFLDAFCFCPCTTLAHLCCLPIACCKPSEEPPSLEYHIISRPSYYPNQIPKEQRKAIADKSYLQSIHRNCSHYACLAGDSFKCTHGD